MAHFALINKDNIVIHVSVVDNSKLLDENGIEQEEIGIKYLMSGKLGERKWKKDESGFYENSELTWKQTSYNAKEGDGFRKNYAGKGYIWNEEIEGFVPPKPKEPNAKYVEEAGQYVLNEEKAMYEFSGKLKTIKI